MPVFMKLGAKGIAPEKKLRDACCASVTRRCRWSGDPRPGAGGGGCELAVHSARRVAAMESYVVVRWKWAWA